MLTAKNINYRYGLAKKDAFELQDVSLTLEPGYVSCLLGKNGSGKTTLLNLLYGMRKPKSGEILWKGQRLDDKTLADFRQEVAYVGEAWCVESMTVAQNMEMLSILYPAFDRDYFDSLMKLAGADGCLDQVFSALSTGERMKLEISFVLARRPKLILLDEPLANIDPVFKVDVLELLQKGVAENETGVLISTHLLDEISDMVDYVNVLENGRLIKSGTRFDVLGEGQLRDIFR
ncbi:MAG: ABC transporter ATP-binding protein [Lachnospiraceae bacterium]|nr:ABC transporter ATP-binding protein [Lachnospiraceae bacterium]